MVSLVTSDGEMEGQTLLAVTGHNVSDNAEVGVVSVAVVNRWDVKVSLRYHQKLGTWNNGIWADWCLVGYMEILQDWRNGEGKLEKERKRQIRPARK